MDPTLQHLQNHLQNIAPELFKSNAPCVLAVSGGPDSMFLLWAMKELLPLEQLFVVHVNYQLRGAESDKDQRLVEEACELWEIECGAFRVDSSTGLAEGENFQDWARRERYRIASEIALAEQETRNSQPKHTHKSTQSAFILTAHHQDDQLETLLMRLLRGAGIRAWQGMPARGPIPTTQSGTTSQPATPSTLPTPELLRPLLEISRAQIMEIIQKEHIPYRIDQSNEESTYARNFLRNQWTPQLDTYFPGWETNLLKLPERAAEYKALADYLLNSCTSPNPSDPGKTEAINAQIWATFSPELKRISLAEWLTKHQIPYSQGQLETAVQALNTLQTGQSHQLSPDLTILRERESFHLQKHDEKNSSPSPHQTDELPTEEENQSAPVIYVMTNSLSDETAHFGLSGATLTLQKRPFLPEENPENPQTLPADTLYLDLASIQAITPEKEPGIIRKWRHGDRIQPLGMQGHQLVSDLLTNHKLTTAQKQQTLVFESGSKLLAVIYPFDYTQSHARLGVISELVKCSSKTRECLVIQVKHG